MRCVFRDIIINQIALEKTINMQRYAILGLSASIIILSVSLALLSEQVFTEKENIE